MGQDAPELFSSTGLLVRSDVALAQSRPAATTAATDEVSPGADSSVIGTAAEGGAAGETALKPRKPQRFYGSVELDLDRPVKSFDAVLNAVVLELQRTPGAKLKITFEIEAQATDGFDDNDVGVIRDNAKQLKFRSESTGFE